MSHGSPVIVCPLEFERRGLRRAGLGPEVRIEVCGPGREGVHKWIGGNRRQDGPVILAGLGGGLIPELGIGDVVAADAVVAPGGRRIETTWRPPSGTGFSERPVTSTSRTVTSRPAKGALHAVSGGDVVDLESQAFAELASDLGWRFGVVRGIGDDLDHLLPPGCDHWVDHRGRAATGPILASLLRQPSLLRRMRAIQRDGERALQGIADLLTRAFEIGDDS